ncbi:alpha/beta-hydrolase [Thozetella sp. PMI_491]|nr:alpha/beta-hydrolase [Thozetella sp. PMI_491]
MLFDSPALPSDHPSDQADFKTGSFTVREQAGDVCETYGEKQWTGTVDVSSDKRLFYWFFESRGNPETDPLIIWMNGGPGGSSMMGLLTEIGPCTLHPSSTHTKPNPYSWNNNASVLFLDQPAGTGLATVAPNRQWPDTDEEGAIDFQYFLNVFFGEIFRQYSNHTIHIAGESYGGHYVPKYLHHILVSRDHNSRNAFWGNITSAILVNALTDSVYTFLGSYDLLCTDLRGHIFNSTVCGEMATVMPECAKLGDLCRETEDGEVCRTAFEYCYINVGKHYNAEQIAGRKSPYNIHLPCTNLPFCWEEGVGNQSTFINQKRVLSALGFDSSFHFQLVNYELNQGYLTTRSNLLPMAPPLSYILDSGRNKARADIKVLVLNGNEDYIVNTPGQIYAFDNLRWSGQADFRSSRWTNWGYKPESSLGNEPFPGSGFWKQTSDAKLVLVGVDGAGHEAPRHAGAATGAILERWLRGW